MDAHQLKQQAKQLPRVDVLLQEFEDSWGERSSQFSALMSASRDVAFAQTVNEKLTSLAHHVVDLKIARALNDTKKAQQIIQSVIRDPHSSLKQLADEVPHIESQILLFCSSYEYMIDEMCRHAPLEQNVTLLEGKHAEVIKRLRDVPAKQKACLALIGKHFVETAREMKQK